MPPWHCVTRPFLVPLLTGVPALKGLSPDCPSRVYLFGYGFGDYGSAAVSSEVSERELCSHALSRGITRVLVLRSIEHRDRNAVLECAADPSVR